VWLRRVKNPSFSWRSQDLGTAAAAALNEVKGLGAAVVPSLRSGRRKAPPRAPDTRGNDKTLLAGKTALPNKNYRRTSKTLH
jgi:hypothetical protein